MLYEPRPPAGADAPFGVRAPRGAELRADVGMQLESMLPTG
jgi:hypothetical protein